MAPPRLVNTWSLCTAPRRARFWGQQRLGACPPASSNQPRCTPRPVAVCWQCADHQLRWSTTICCWRRLSWKVKGSLPRCLFPGAPLRKRNTWEAALFASQLNLTSAGHTKKVYSHQQRKISPIFASRAFASDAFANEAFQGEPGGQGLLSESHRPWLALGTRKYHALPWFQCLKNKGALCTAGPAISISQRVAKRGHRYRRCHN